jgi:hypothetical protein
MALDENQLAWCNGLIGNNKEIAAVPKRHFQVALKHPTWLSS